MSQITREWSQWWKSQSWLRRLAPAVAVFSYWILISAIGTLSVDHIGPLSVMLALYYLGTKTRPAFDFFLPLILVMLVYDSQRYYGDYIRGPIHVREPYDFDKYFFGIREGGKTLTPSEWFQLHNHWILDLITGIFYIAFVPIFLGFAAYFQFVLSKVGNSKRSADYVREQSPQIMWAFFWLNVVGYTTYYWYAASPPWYAEMYGFGPARTDVPGDPAGCIRFDAIFGTHIFDEWYGRAADVHGAIPSLHIAYPLLAVYYAFKFGSLRAMAIQYYVWLCFSAVYLNHHYVLDVLVGSIYALAAGWLTDRYWNYRLSQRLPQNKVTAAYANSLL